ncbi:MAG: hypothetical protein HOJ21_01660, partial [Alphaproteobacteria bacterium]|nr:hypothetical protein [Alphaproteobacteria bacterium]
MSLRMRPLGDALGVEIIGIDLATSVSKQDIETLQTTLADRLVMVIRDQSLDPTELLAALRLFGETMPQHLSDMLMPGHPEIAVLDSRKAPKGSDGRVM